MGIVGRHRRKKVAGGDKFGYRNILRKGVHCLVCEISTFKIRQKGAGGGGYRRCRRPVAFNGVARYRCELAKHVVLKKPAGPVVLKLT